MHTFPSTVDKAKNQTIYNQTVIKLIAWIIIGIGIFLRSYHYFLNRSLYTDEAYLVNNLLTRDLHQLTLPLDSNQHAPILFLVIVKLFMDTFGAAEYLLRFIPFVSGLAALISFYYLLKKFSWITAAGLFTGLAIFTFSFPLIYFSSEFKQYSGEVLGTIICYLLYINYKQSRSLKDLIIYAFVGGILVWLSYSSIFILASIGIVHVLFLVIKNEWKTALIYMPVYAFWAINFLANLILLIIPNSFESSPIVNTWKMAYPPLSFHSIADIKWYLDAVFLLFDFPLGLNWNFLQESIHPKLTLSVVGLVSILIGAYSWHKKNSEQMFVMVTPVFLTLLAAALEKYPFSERFLLFLAPNLILLISAGISAINTFLHRNRFKSFWLASIILILLFPTFYRSSFDVIHHEKFGEWKRRDVRSVITYLKTNRQPEEPIMLYFTATPFIYYNTIYQLKWPYTIFPLDYQLEPQEITDKVIKQGGRRFWIMVTGNLQTEKGSLNDREIFIKFFDDNFKRIKVYKTIGVHTILYELPDNYQ